MVPYRYKFPPQARHCKHCRETKHAIWFTSLSDWKLPLNSRTGNCWTCEGSFARKFLETANGNA